MSDVNERSLSLTDRLEAIRGLLASAPGGIAAGDLTALGRLHEIYEQTYALLDPPEQNAEFGRLARVLTQICEKIILAELDQPAEAADFVLQAARALVTALGESPATLPAGGELLPQAGKFLPLPPAGTAAEAAAPADRIAIAGEEDYIIYAEFVSESSEHLETIEARVLALENQTANTDLVNDMFRCFHSMKGAAGFLGLLAINTLGHEVETLLDRARKLTLKVDRSVVDVLLAAIDACKRLLEDISRQLASRRAGEPAATAEAAVDIRPLLAAVRRLLERAPTAAAGAADTGPDLDKIGGYLVAEGVVTEDQLEQALRRQKLPVGEILVEMGAAPADKVKEALGRQAASGKVAEAAIKVDTARLDALMEMVGELVIAQSLVAQDQTVRDPQNAQLARNVSNLTKITRNLQELAMAIRMIPLRQTFQKMVRLVRDTARKTGKEARLELRGEETEIDKTLIDALADPLVHMLRNAVDHGLETPETRQAQGKPAEGRVALEACHEGGNVVITVRDDGKGLDRERILQKARERGLARPDQEYSPDEILEFVFLPGFSTNDQASDISGRGVGMDVVKRNIEGIGGRVEVESETGQGSLFTVRLPLTMAIVDGMIVRVGGVRYVLPTLGIEESIRPRQEDVCTVTQRGEMLKVRGSLVPLSRLHRLFNAAGDRREAWESLVIVLGAGGRRCGLVVDELEGQQQVVIKNLGTHLQGIAGISGGCILGDGRVGLILDVPGLVELAQAGG